MIVNEKQIEYIISVIEASKKTQGDIATGAGISTPTLSRLMKHRQATKYTVDLLAAYFEVGDKVAELGGSEYQSSCPLVAGVSNELKRLEGIFAERETRLQVQFDERVEYLKKQLDMMEEHHNQVVERMQTNINFLKDENALLRAENKELINKQQKVHEESKSVVEKAEKQANEILKKKHVVYRSAIIVSVLLAVCVAIMAVLLYYALKSDAILP